MLAQQDTAELLKTRRRVVERPDDALALLGPERQHFHLAAGEPILERWASAGSSTRRASLRTASSLTGIPANKNMRSTILRLGRPA